MASWARMDAIRSFGSPYSTSTAVTARTSEEVNNMGAWPERKAPAIWLNASDPVGKCRTSQHVLNVSPRTVLMLVLVFCPATAPFSPAS
mmetsp:Transcript_12854/g.22533  ORF Transcript_12854/g.22533 Transcript_12854/m.22533 type:complete len:89 (-) Transcript_12854:142-408(-)